MLLTHLETHRLRLRPLTLEDVPTLMSFWENPVATRYLSVTEDKQQHCVTWVNRQLVRYENDALGLMALICKTTGAFIGQCGLVWQFVDNLDELEVGYHIQPSYWGQGYATEAAKACQEKAFAENIAPSIISIIHVDNIASQKVATRNGLQREKAISFKGFPVYLYRRQNRYLTTSQ
ncbi:GNAT family N-acetyltransferase [Beggiatoa leptomitoformis]|uniref:GNAT family N-acetyltransferase n=1 Tax=Beggiatoa leptomitoformis TaxID=288004 RepID=A0A2N9YCR6_9GAMM|nr:GNAT family N-acetyltransferase [Beggiatoa leptomitoformis]ALG66468.1 GNAT family N-acetyltransferase [Beggiatoa leptomitoformis]AUI68247.1 GNAT family N-acetyltransferase [Beggiatoa leptomitoformis]